MFRERVTYGDKKKGICEEQIINFFPKFRYLGTVLIWGKFLKINAKRVKKDYMCDLHRN